MWHCSTPESKGPALWMHILAVVMRRERVSNDMSRGSKYNRGIKKYKPREKHRVVQQGQGCWGEKGGREVTYYLGSSGNVSLTEKTRDGEA